MKDKNKSLQSMVAKDAFDMFPFKADRGYETYKKNGGYSKTMSSKDGLITAKFTANELLGVQEMKVFALIIRNCIGEARYELTNETANGNKRANGLSFDVREAARLIRPRTAKDDRKSIVDSLMRLKSMDIFITRRPATPEIDRRTKFADTKWVFEVLFDDEYEKAELLVSRSLVEISNSDSIGYNIGRLFDLYDKAAILYFMMQGFKMEDEKIPNRFVYQSQVSHKKIIEALAMESLPLKVQNQRIKETFGKIALNFSKRGDYWVKIKPKEIK